MQVLKQHTYSEGEWRNIFILANIRFEVTDQDAEFYGDAEAASKAAANELRALNFVGFDAVEQVRDSAACRRHEVVRCERKARGWPGSWACGIRGLMRDLSAGPLSTADGTA